MRLGAPPDRQEDLLGDLEELHAERVGRFGEIRARWITAADALTVASAFFVHRLQERAEMDRWISWIDIKLAIRQVRKRPLLEATAFIALTV
ncbi:MAG: permease prefix domain 2-containing transporter, partial [Acidobacteriota bacterium]